MSKLRKKCKNTNTKQKLQYKNGMCVSQLRVSQCLWVEVKSLFKFCCLSLFVYIKCSYGHTCTYIHIHTHTPLYLCMQEAQVKE